MLSYFSARLMEDRYNNGYDYAAGRLLREGAAAIAILEQEVANATDFKTNDEFDVGIKDALKKFNSEEE